MNKILKRIIVAANDNDDNNDDNENEELEFDFDSMFADDDDDDDNDNNGSTASPPTEERSKSDLEQQIAGDMFNDDSSFDPYQSSMSTSTPAMNGQLVQNMFLGLANEGRGVLKRIEDYKFKIIQSINLLNANPELKTKVEQKKKILESAAAQVYGIVFDLENFDLTPNYEDEQLSGESFPSFNGDDDDNENNEGEELDLNMDENEEMNAGESDEEIPSNDEGGGEEGENSKNMDLGDMDMDLELPPAEESEE